MRATLAAVTLSTFAGSILIIGFGTISLAYRRFVDIELVKRRIPSVINFSQHLMTIVLALLGLVVDAGLIVGALLLN